MYFCCWFPLRPGLFTYGFFYGSVRFALSAMRSHRVGESRGKRECASSAMRSPVLHVHKPTAPHPSSNLQKMSGFLHEIDWYVQENASMCMGLTGMCKFCCVYARNIAHSSQSHALSCWLFCNLVSAFILYQVINSQRLWWRRTGVLHESRV